MSSYLYAYPAPLVFTLEDPKPGYMVFDQEIDQEIDEQYYVYLSDRELGYADGTLVGAWNSDGSVMRDVAGDPIPIDPLFDSLRPFGNIDGAAVDSLNYHYWMGDLQRHVQAEPVVDTNPVYPADNQPFEVRFSRRWDDTPGFEGWGWEAIIEFSDPNRAPDARAIGIYDDAWAYQYTTGAFVWTDMGDDVFKWRTISPPGFATAEKEDIYYALLFGAAQEGKMVLPATTDSQIRYFWEADQVIPGEAWVDVGQTVTIVYSTVVVPEDINLFPVGTQVRIKGVEYVVATIWASQGFTTTPNADHTGSVGEIIWIWQ